MAQNKNIFCASNPTRISDALWTMLSDDNSDFSDDIIFLPSRRAVRNVEKMIVDKTGHAALLPQLIALGEGADEEESPDADMDADIVTSLERAIVLAKLLSAQMNSGFSAALPVAKDLVRMMDYLENETSNLKSQISNPKWSELVDEKYAAHFQEKARFLDLASRALPLVFSGRETAAQKRNRDIRSWIDHLENRKSDIVNRKSKIIVCGSTGSVPATADLMEYIAGLDNGCVILPGKINEKRKAKGELRITDPYYSEMNFLERLEIQPEDVQTINVGDSSIGFFNAAFSNSSLASRLSPLASHLTRIDCAREAEEADVVAEIATESVAAGKSVLVVTPDAAANQRLAESFARRGVDADFSGGKSGAAVPLGRLILQLFDKDKNFDLYNEYKKSNLFNAITSAVQEMVDSNAPNTPIVTDDQSIAVWDAVRELSDVLVRHGLELSPADLRAAVADALSRISLRPPMINGARAGTGHNITNGYIVPSSVAVLGTIESRMATSDVVILTGLNEGMFPATGYENPWLPRHAAQSLGLPPPERKVSLMALDFITLSCAREVYWTRSKTSGGTETTESRFLSRVAVAQARQVTGDRLQVTGSLPHDEPMPKITGDVSSDTESPVTCHMSPVTILSRVRARDNVPHRPLDYSAPTPPADWSPVYVTDLEYLFHNPYAFYARHILGLRPDPDPWDDAYAIKFGNLVHEVIEKSTMNNEQLTIDGIVTALNTAARDVLEPGSVLFHFWAMRFSEMAPKIKEFLDAAIGAAWSAAEKTARGETLIGGRQVRAKADKVWIKDGIGVAADIKTGKIPKNSQLNDGMMPQLPLEALILERKGFTGQPRTPARVIMQYLSLGRGNCAIIEYADEDLRNKITATVANTEKYFNQYSAGGAPYEYRETSEEKFKVYDDLARVGD